MENFSFIEYFLQKHGCLVFQPIYFSNGASQNGLRLYGMEVLTKFSTNVNLPDFFSMLHEKPLKLFSFYRWQCENLLKVKEYFLSTGIKLFINFFPRALLYVPVYRFLEKLEKEFNEKIVIEITEAGFSAGSDFLMQFLKDLKKEFKNTKIFIDDFGSGETGAFYQFICEDVVDGIKLDKRYLDLMLKGKKKARVIVEHTVSMARRIGLEVCMEGIENREGYEITRRLGISLLQGFYLGKPERFQREKFLKALRVPEVEET